MKNFLSLFICVYIVSFLIGGMSVFSKPAGGYNNNHNHNHSHYHSSSPHSGSDNNVYLVNTDYKKSEQKFPECNEHYVVTETITNYYSNGTRNVYMNSTIYNSDGSVLKSDCQSVEHVVYENIHYFLIKKDGYFQIIDDKGKIISQRRYSRMKEIEPNRILVRFDKKFGIIDLAEETIVPIKYQEFKQVNNNIFITKLNHYYGVIDLNNTIYMKNECEKIKQYGDLLLIKKYNKYGFMSPKGEWLSEINFDKAKRLGEYILAKKDDLYSVYDSSGKMISDFRYRKVRLERNTLQGNVNGMWLNIETDTKI